MHTDTLAPPRPALPADLTIHDEACCDAPSRIAEAVNERAKVRCEPCADGPNVCSVEPFTLRVAFAGDTSIPLEVAGDVQHGLKWVEWHAAMNPWSGRTTVDGAAVFDYEVE